MKNLCALVLPSFAWLMALVAGASGSWGANLPTVREEVVPASGQRYTIVIPGGYSPGKPVPLVLALHYGGTVTPYFSKPFLVNLVEPALRKLGAIIVAPDCTAGRWTEPQAETDVLVLLDHVRASWAIDPARTLITGFSMGGMGTWALAARHQELFTAALIVAGRPQEGSAEVAWRIPLYLIHSRNDEVVPLGPTAAIAKVLDDKGVKVKLVVVDGVTHYQVPAFVPYMRAAIPWIERAWKK
ncbi:MAG: prolyl oligopeptidase family serine peptidase [Thermoanaerobaculaceae bacterium]|nr:prolyl oligopeptidase family serine peptidase [Thermoanaerobaculaceae bacterium]MDI9620685.1 prolyl oligopeptidase family serine peptidase [Acidobacteriota bacterium]NLH10320.1 prolyl oligopeptidase family serine peptidase [Holophagae bacterium]